jgi:hypothetical protein
MTDKGRVCASKGVIVESGPENSILMALSKIGKIGIGNVF